MFLLFLIEEKVNFDVVLELSLLLTSDELSFDVELLLAADVAA
jgi:hypothetical protein